MYLKERLSKFFSKKDATINIAKAVETSVREPLFGGVPISKFSDLAKKCYHGLGCSIDQWGFLIFHYKSNRGHERYKVQMEINEMGKLVSLGGHYPGQRKSTADVFAEMVNETLELHK